MRIGLILSNLEHLLEKRLARFVASVESLGTYR